MKRVVFIDGDFELSIQPDWSDAETGQPGQVRLQGVGTDMDGEGDTPVRVFGAFSPDEAREIAEQIREAADRAEEVQS